MDNKRILLTGGHAATTALATFEALQKQNKNAKYYWIGSRLATEGNKYSVIDKKIFKGTNVNDYYLVSGRYQNKWTRYTFISLFKVPIGFIHAIILLIKIRPYVVLSFGGFVALPVVIIAWLMRTPVILHEQTIAIGLANKLSIFFADKIAISREQSKKYFPDQKVVLTGLPIRKKITSIKKKTRKAKVPTVFITGGSRGSQRINSMISEALEELLGDYKIIHQTGEPDYNKFINFRQNLKPELKNRYVVISSVHPDEIAEIFNKTDIVVSRAGANTIAEIINIGIPSLIIPIPWTRYNEQVKNAQLAEKVGVSEILYEDKMSKTMLVKSLNKINSNWKKMAMAKNECIRKLDSNAAKKLAELVASYIK